jgi:hypothetical protein
MARLSGTSATNGVFVLNFQGAALQLAGGITTSMPLNLNNTGINTGGALESVSGKQYRERRDYLEQCGGHRRG